MSTPQPPSFEPPIRRRSLRSRQDAQSGAQGETSSNAARDHAGSQRTPRRSVLPSSEQRSELPTARPRGASQPPSFAPARMRQRFHDADTVPSPQAPRTARTRPGEAGQGPARSQPYTPPSANHPVTAGRPTFPATAASAPPRAPHGLSAPPPQGPHRGKRRARRALLTVVLIAALVIGWPLFLVMDANANMGRVDALSPAPATPGTTFLLAGSDARANGPIQDDTEGARADSIMLVHIAPNGQEVAVSLPRDTWVDIPDYGENKLNAAYALGGSPLLVSTVESLTGLTVDHYVEVGMGGVANVVDAVGGVELCLDYDVDDYRSELQWTAGCHVSDGRTALAFSRMRYADPLGDIGRAERQRQVVSQTVKAALSPTTLIWPPSALALERAGAGALSVDNDTSGLDIFTLVRAFRSAGANKMTGTPPIVSLNYETSAGSAVLLEDTTAPDFFAKLRQGDLIPEDLQHVTP